MVGDENGRYMIASSNRWLTGRLLHRNVHKGAAHSLQERSSQATKKAHEVRGNIHIKERSLLGRVKSMGWIVISALCIEMAQLEDFGATQDYALFRLIADIRAKMLNNSVLPRVGSRFGSQVDLSNRHPS
jgi:hypothetical protein